MNIQAGLLTILLLLTVLALAANLVKSNESPTNAKWSQFECGFNTITPLRLPFSFQFFLVALLFLIFDIEIALVLSYPLEPQSQTNTAFLFIFATALTIGLLYEWNNSKIDWSE